MPSENETKPRSDSGSLFSEDDRNTLLEEEQTRTTHRTPVYTEKTRSFALKTTDTSQVITVTADSRPRKSFCFDVMDMPRDTNVMEIDQKPFVLYHINNTQLKRPQLPSLFYHLLSTGANMNRHTRHVNCICPIHGMTHCLFLADLNKQIAHVNNMDCACEQCIASMERNPDGIVLSEVSSENIERTVCENACPDFLKRVKQGQIAIHAMVKPNEHDEFNFDPVEFKPAAFLWSLVAYAVPDRKYLCTGMVLDEYFDILPIEACVDADGTVRFFQSRKPIMHRGTGALEQFKRAIVEHVRYLDPRQYGRASVSRRRADGRGKDVLIDCSNQRLYGTRVDISEAIISGSSTFRVKFTPKWKCTIHKDEPCLFRFDYNHESRDPYRCNHIGSMTSALSGAYKSNYPMSFKDVTAFFAHIGQAEYAGDTIDLSRLPNTCVILPINRFNAGKEYTIFYVRFKRDWKCSTHGDGLCVFRLARSDQQRVVIHLEHSTERNIEPSALKPREKTTGTKVNITGKLGEFMRKHGTYSDPISTPNPTDTPAPIVPTTTTTSIVNNISILMSDGNKTSSSSSPVHVPAATRSSLFKFAAETLERTRQGDGEISDNNDDEAFSECCERVARTRANREARARTETKQPANPVVAAVTAKRTTPSFRNEEPKQAPPHENQSSNSTEDERTHQKKDELATPLEAKRTRLERDGEPHAKAPEKRVVESTGRDVIRLDLDDENPPKPPAKPIVTLQRCSSTDSDVSIFTKGDTRGDVQIGRIKTGYAIQTEFGSFKASIVEIDTCNCTMSYIAEAKRIIANKQTLAEDTSRVKDSINRMHLVLVLNFTCKDTLLVAIAIANAVGVSEGSPAKNLKLVYKGQHDSEASLHEITSIANEIRNTNPGRIAEAVLCTAQGPSGLYSVSVDFSFLHSN